MSGEDTTGRDASGGRGADGDEAAWRDLIARFDMSPGHEDDVPWPERESLTPPVPASGAVGAESADLDTADPGTADPETADPEAANPETADPETADPLRGADRARVIRPATPQPNGISVPLPPADAVGAALTGPGQADAADADADENGIDEEEHFVPPPPPPLPHLDSVAKGAWTALFGGPAYLLAATLLGWVVPGWAALLAVIAFVGGFAMVAVRLGDRRSDDTDSDDGAVL